MRGLNFRASSKKKAAPGTKAPPGNKTSAKKAGLTAPSRPSRRMRWLRRFQVTGLLIIGSVAALGGGFWVLHSNGGAAFLARGREHFLMATAALGFVVQGVEVEGRERTSADAVLGLLGADRGTPLFAVDPAEAKARLETLSWVKQASVERRWPDTLHIRLTERQPLAFWQRQKRLCLIDHDGAVITDSQLERFPGLVVVVGDDAPKHAAELLSMLAGEPDVGHRVTAAVRVGGRRWNLRFDNGIDVQLPETDAAAAWTRLAELERGQAVLKRDVQMIDLRLPDRLVLRVAPEQPKDTPKKARAGAKAT